MNTFIFSLGTDLLINFTTFQGHKKWITGISWEPLHLSSPCRRFVSSSKDGDARIWDVTLRRSVICLSGHTLAVTCVKWGGDGFIYTGYIIYAIPNYNYIFRYSQCVFFPIDKLTRIIIQTPINASYK
ncbi:putative transcription factor WD40-like family [Helianthus annuus]|nr:putative transcription factor WD40-like family [Helianthus annuus]